MVLRLAHYLVGKYSIPAFAEKISNVHKTVLEENLGFTSKGREGLFRPDKSDKTKESHARFEYIMLSHYYL